MVLTVVRLMGLGKDYSQGKHFRRRLSRHEMMKTSSRIGRKEVGERYSEGRHDEMMYMTDL